jgi:hypothetical protein
MAIAVPREDTQMLQADILCPLQCPVILKNDKQPWNGCTPDPGNFETPR